MPKSRKVSVYQYPSENQNRQSGFNNQIDVSVYQYPSENQNLEALHTSAFFVSVYQYPSENQNFQRRRSALCGVSVYQYPSENQNREVFFMGRPKYQFINIHQRTKTEAVTNAQTVRISLSISIREPKPKLSCIAGQFRISLSISIREPKQLFKS